MMRTPYGDNGYAANAPKNLPNPYLSADNTSLHEMPKTSLNYPYHPTNVSSNIQAPLYGYPNFTKPYEDPRAPMASEFK